MAVYNSITRPFSQTNFVSDAQGESAKNKIISRTRITLQAFGAGFSPTQFNRLRQIESLLTSPLYQEGGLDLLKSVDRRTFNEYNKLASAYRSSSNSRGTPGFYAIQRSVINGVNEPASSY